MKSSSPSADPLEQEYRRRYEEALLPTASALKEHVRGILSIYHRIDRISARAKGVASFVGKANKQENGERKYSEPLSQIQDQIGCRVVTYFLDDVERIDQLIEKYFHYIEIKDHVPDSEWEFGYFGRHRILLLPEDVINEGIDRDMVPRFFELQIKTLFQHAWAEAEHDLGYKPGEKPLSSEQKRLLAFASAQAWGADRVFNDLSSERTALQAISRPATPRA